jgi:hypothetical protein
MSVTMRRYVAEKENFVASRGFNVVEAAANKLRMEFVRRFIVNFDVNLYKTQ